MESPRSTATTPEVKPEHADGTLTLTHYTIVSGKKQVIQKRGAPNGQRTDVIDGTLTTSHYDEAGILESETVTDIASGLPLSGRSVTVRDARGRALEVEYADGTSEEFEYTCCGLIREVNRDGIESHHTYDALRRRTSTTRGGITMETAYDALDRVTSVTQPSADGVASGLTTGYNYNVLGQRTKVTLPDSSETDYEYYPTGELKKVSGSQSYTVEYTYDPQGRKVSMTTTGQAGPATTSWQYHAQRGWLTAKRYDNNEGPDYTYNAAGKLLTRTWARGITTSYSYNKAGDLTGVTYSDSTPAISYRYDRRGRRIETIDASGTRAFTYHSGGGRSTN